MAMDVDPKEFVMDLPVDYVIAFTSYHNHTLYYHGGTTWTWSRGQAAKFATRQLAEWQNTTLPYPDQNCIIALFK